MMHGHVDCPCCEEDYTIIINDINKITLTHECDECAEDFTVTIEIEITLSADEIN